MEEKRVCQGVYASYEEAAADVDTAESTKKKDNEVTTDSVIALELLKRTRKRQRPAAPSV